LKTSVTRGAGESVPLAPIETLRASPRSTSAREFTDHICGSAANIVNVEKTVITMAELICRIEF
jgi:hypothetical protein